MAVIENLLEMHCNTETKISITILFAKFPNIVPIALIVMPGTYEATST